jgi:hypothetical protein
MAEVIKQQPQVTEQLTQDTLTKSGYNVGAGFIKAISDKVSVLVKGFAEYNFKQRFKESGFFGIVKDAAQSFFRKPKQAPIVQDTIEKAVLPKQKAPPPLVQDSIEKATTPKPSATLPLVSDETSTATNLNKQNTLTQGIFPGFEQKEKPKEKKLIETEEKARIVLIGGITDEGVERFKEKLPEIFEEVFKKLPKDGQKPIDAKSKFSEGGLLGMLPPGLLAMGGGLALLLGGLAALVAGLQTDGPFKGLLKIFSKVGLQGGLKMLEKGAKTFLKTLESFIKAPLSLVDEAATGLKGMLGKLMPKGIITNIIKGTANIFSKMLSGLVKIITPLLKRLPLVGTIISFGFAYTRFKSGDTIGGIIDVLSGIATLVPGVGTAISIGLDVLNAFLDFKTGGATAETSQKKGNILKDWVKGIGSWFAKNAENFPLIGPLIKTGRLIGESKWAEALASVVEWIPGVSWVLDWLGYTSEKRTEAAQKGISGISNTISSFMSWINESVWGTVSGFFTGIFDSVKSYWDNLSWDPRSWVGMTPDPGSPETKQTTSSTQDVKPKMGQGGVIPATATALVGEAGDEAIIPLAKGGVVATQPTLTPINQIDNNAVIPLEKYFNGKDFSLSNGTLEKIASNTGSTNDGLKTLGQAILKLAQVYESKSKTGSNNIIVNNKSQEQIPSASQVAAANIDPIRAIRAQFAI